MTPNSTPIFIINLQQDVTKKLHMQQLCNKYNLSYQFTDAVNGRHLSKKSIQEITHKNKSFQEIGRELVSSEIGCALSHIFIYKEIIATNIEYALILEDDVVFSDVLFSIINSVKKFPKNWELMLLGYYSNITKEKESKSSLRYKKQILGRFKAVRLVQLAYGTHGYMINRKGAEKLLKELALIIKPIDHYTGVEEYINMYAISPRVIKINSDFKNMSSIQWERNQNKSVSKIQISIGKKILLQILSLNFAGRTKRYLKTTYVRFKKPKQYE